MANKKTRCKSCGINLATMIVRARELSRVKCYDPEKLTSLQWKQLQRQTIKGMFDRDSLFLSKAKGVPNTRGTKNNFLQLKRPEPCTKLAQCRFFCSWKWKDERTTAPKHRTYEEKNNDYEPRKPQTYKEVAITWYVYSYVHLVWPSTRRGSRGCKI